MMRPLPPNNFAAPGVARKRQVVMVFVLFAAALLLGQSAPPVVKPVQLCGDVAGVPCTLAPAAPAAPAVPVSAAKTVAGPAAEAVKPRPTIRLVSQLPAGRVGRTYRVPLIIKGTNLYVIDVKSNLPPGIGLGNDGFLVGRPMTAGTYRPHIEAHDATSLTDKVVGDWILPIFPPVEPRIENTSNPEPVRKPTLAPPTDFGPPLAAAEMLVYRLDKADLANLDSSPLDSRLAGALGLASCVPETVSKIQKTSPPTKAASQANTKAPSAQKGASKTNGSKATSAAPAATTSAATGIDSNSSVGVIGLAGVPLQITVNINMPTANSESKAAAAATAAAGDSKGPAAAGGTAGTNKNSGTVPDNAAGASTGDEALVLDVCAPPLASVLPINLPEPPPVASVQTLLGALQDIEYPSRAAFVAAARYMLSQNSVASDQLAFVVEKAAKPNIFNKAELALHWRAGNNCNCVRDRVDTDYTRVYGFMPFWRATADKPDAPTIEFDLFDRISILGLHLSPGGDWLRAQTANQTEQQWWDNASRLAVTAQRHGTRLDLVLHANDWSKLAGKKNQEIENMAASAARGAIPYLVHSNSAGLAWYDRLLIGSWAPPKTVFSGLTVMLTPPPTAVPGFETWYDSFVRTLIIAMRTESGRRDELALNIVINDSAFCTPGNVKAPVLCPPGSFSPKRLKELRAMIEQAMPPAANAQAVDLRFLVVMLEFVGNSKKHMRATIDNMEINGAVDAAGLDGIDRVKLLRSIIPVVMYPAGPGEPKQEEPVRTFQQTRLTKDLVYFNQNFAGVAVWPVPMTGVGDSDFVTSQIKATFFTTPAADFNATGTLGPLINTLVHWWYAESPQCSAWVRLAFQALIIIAVVAWLLYLFREDPARILRYYQLAALVALVLALLLGCYLYLVDPTLANSWWPGAMLLTFVLMIFAHFFIDAIRQRIRRP